MKKNKIAIVISTFSSLLENQMNKHEDIFLTPLQLFIGANQWFEGFYSEKERDKIVELFKNADDFKTSLGPILMLEEQMTKLSKEYEYVIYMPINANLSSSHDSILNLSKNFKNVFVINNKLVGHAYLEAAEEAKRLFEKEKLPIEKVLEFLKWYDERSIGYILPFELRTFIKSGRLKGIKKAIMTSLNLSTIVEFDYVLSSGGVAKSKKSAASKIMSKIENFIANKNMSIDDFNISTIYAFDKNITNILTESMLKYFNKKVNRTHEASLATMFHTGWGAGFIGINPKIKLFKK